VGVMQAFALAGRPFGEQHSAGIFPAKDRAKARSNARPKSIAARVSFSFHPSRYRCR
jgi:hypothetical protein